MMSLVEPLYLISTLTLVPHLLRSFAVEKLRKISRSMGIRQAAVLADIACRNLDT